MRETIMDYEKKLRFADMQPSTIKSYSRNLQDFFLYTQTDNITDSMIEEYLDKLSTKQISKTAWNQKMYAIKWYYENILKKDWPQFIRKKKPRRKIKNVPEKNKILQSILNYEDLRRKTIMLLFYDGWLRRSELQTLKTEYVDMQKSEIYLSAGKGDKDRIITISSTTLNFIKYYLYSRQNKINPYLIHKEDSEDKYMSKKYIYDVVKEAGKSVGCDNWHPHLLRHAGATHTWLETADLVSISEKLGHNKIETTMIYLNLSERDLVRKKIKAVSPLLSLSKCT